MAEKRRQDPEEFKREASRLVTEQGDSESETARHLGIKAQMLGRWQREFETKGRAAVPGHGRMASAQEALQRWRDAKKRWRMERDLLTNALGFCASGST